MSQLTSQERVNRAFEGKDHDHVPRHESFWADSIRRWKEEGLTGDRGEVLDLLGSDFHGLNWCWPQAYPGEEQRISETDETYVVRDTNGKLVRYWKHKSGTPEHLGFECDSREAWEKRFKPALLDTGLQQDPDAIRRAYRKGRSRGKWCHLTAVESFEETRALMGDEISLMAMVEDPEWVIDVSRTFTDVVLRNLDAVMATGIQPDGLWVYGDMAYNHATMCSPEMYRELIWPDHKRLADWAHAHRMKFIYHTDGDVNAVMDLYLAAGFDCLQPLEAKAGMDIRKLCPKYADRMAFFGNCNVMVYASNDRAQIEAEIAGKLNAGKATKRYIYHSDHSVPPQVSWDSYQFIIDCVKRHGNYE